VLPVTLTVLVAHALLALAVAVLMVVLLRLAFGARPPRWSTPLQIAGLLSPDLKGGFSMELTASVFDNMKIAADNFKISSALGGTPLVGGYFLSSWPDCGI
jgi:preprotein translocase subunit SecD